jgi:branched-chain amino acid transport system substrate-binding protein
MKAWNKFVMVFGGPRSALLLALLCPVAWADTTVQIGASAPLTGGTAHTGQDLIDGIRLAIAEINQAGLTINGEKIILTVNAQDDAADPKTGSQVAQKLVDDGVVAVVGHLNSGVSIPASKIYAAAGVTQLTPASTNPAYSRQGLKTTFRGLATDAQLGPALANYTQQTLKAKTVSIVDDATAFGQGLADEFEKTARANGLQVLSRDATHDKATDFKAILTRIKAARPDVIMYGGMDATAAPFAKQAMQLAIRAKILGGDGVCTSNLASLAGKAADNIICAIAGPDLSRIQGGAEFAAKLKAAYGHDPVLYAPLSYDAAYVIVDAMKRAGSVKRADILAAMPATNYNGLTGNIQFDQYGDLKGAAVSLYKYVGGKQTLLDVLKM